MSQDEPDPAANTERFRAFVESDEPARSGPSGAGRGVVVALGSLVAVAAIVAVVSFLFVSG